MALVATRLCSCGAALTGNRRRCESCTAVARCTHCGNPCGFLRRNLCGPCYSSPRIRDKYRSYANNPSVGTGNSKSPLPRKATSASPGTEEKIQEMIRRAERMESLFHPLDGPPRNLTEPGPDEVRFLEPTEADLAAIERGELEYSRPTREYAPHRVMVPDSWVCNGHRVRKILD